MPSLSQLFVTLDLKSTEFISGIRDSQREAKELEKALNPLTKAIGDVGKTMIGVGASITAIAAPFALMAKSAIDSADALSKMAQRTGVSIQTLSALKVQAELADVSMESLATAMKKSSAVLENAASGSKTAEESLRKLGLSATDLFKLNPDDRFFAIAKSIESIQDPTIKAALAQEVLGKAGTDLLTLLPTLASEGIDGVTKSARDMNAVMTESGGKAAEAFNDSITRLGQSFTGLFNAIANSGLLEKITAFINKIADLVSGFGQAHPQLLAIGAAIGGLAVIIGPVVAGIGLVVAGISAFIGPAAAVIGSITGLVSGFGGVIGIGTALVAVLTGPVGIVIGIGAAVAGFIAFRHEIAGAFLAMMSSLVQSWANLIGGLAKVSDALGATGLSSKLRDVQGYLQAGAEKTYLLGKSMTETKVVIEEKTEAIKKATAATHSYNVITSEQIEAEKKAREEAEKFAKAIRDQVAALKGTSEENRKLVATLIESEKQHVDMRTVVEKLGKASEDYAQILKRQGLEIPAVVQRVIDAKKAFEELSVSMAEAARIIQENSDKFANYSAGIIPAAASIDGLTQKIIDLNYELKRTKPPDFEIWRVEADRISGAFGNINQKLEDMSQVHVGNVRKAVGENKKALEQAAQDVKNSAGHIFDDMLIKGEGVFGSLKNMLKGGALSLGRSIFEDITGTLLGPVKAAFDNFFKTTVSGLIKNAFGGLGDSLSKLLGGGLNLGGASAGVAGGGGGLLGLGGAAGAGGGISGAALGAFFTNPFTIAIGGAVAAAVVWWKSQAHHTADTFVREFQNPFGEQLTAIADKFFKAAQAGDLTSEAAQTTVDSVEELWAAFTESANEFAKRGGKEALIVRQAFETLAFIPNQLLPDMKSVVGQLKIETVDTTDGLANLADAAGDLGRTATTGASDVGTLADGITGLSGTVADSVSIFVEAAGRVRDAMQPFAGMTSGAPGVSFPSGGVTTTAGQAGIMGVQNFTLQDITNAFNAWATQAAAMNSVGVNARPFLWFGQPWQPGDPLPSSTVNLGLPTYQGGTDYVPATGPYLLHKGEQVIPENERRQPVNVNISVSTLDASDFEKVVKTKIAPMLDKVVRHGGVQLTASRMHRA